MNLSSSPSVVDCFPWRDSWPLPALTDDGNPWSTGMCWLYCRREEVRVLWVGSINTPLARGDIYSCGACIAELDHIVRLQLRERDSRPQHPETGTVTLPPHTPAPAAATSPEARFTPPNEPSPFPPPSPAPSGPRFGAEQHGPCRHLVLRGDKHCEKCGRRIYL